MHGAFYDVIPTSLDPKIREISELRIQQSLLLAQQLKVSAVVFHTNYNPYFHHPDYLTTWLNENAAYWSKKLEEFPDLQIYLENMFDADPDVLLELSHRLSTHENYGVCLDFSHATLSLVPPEIWAQKLSKYIKHIHINDNDLENDLHLAWGDGKIDRANFYDCYQKYMSNATILIETNSIENIKKSLQILKQDGFLE